MNKHKDPVYAAAWAILDDRASITVSDSEVVAVKAALIKALEDALDDERPPITHVACIDIEGRIWSLPKPYRHHDILMLMYERGTKCAEDGTYNQGFLDASGRYLHRKAAILSAEANNQIKNGKIIGGGILTSEDVW